VTLTSSTTVCARREAGPPKKIPASRRPPTSPANSGSLGRDNIGCGGWISSVVASSGAGRAYEPIDRLCPEHTEVDGELVDGY
jgi:hypothetical protein